MRSVHTVDTTDVKKSGKGKAREATQPTQGLAVKELCEQLRLLRDETKSRFLPYRSRDLGNFWSQHPRFGPMTLYERICLLGYHERKHLFQMHRAAAAL